MGFLQTIQQTKTDGRCSGKLIRQSDQLVCGGGKSEVLVRRAARVVRDQGEANPVVANVYIRMMASLLGRAGHLVDKGHGVREGLELEGSHQFTAFDPPIGMGSQPGSDFCLGNSRFKYQCFALIFELCVIPSQKSLRDF